MVIGIFKAESVRKVKKNPFYGNYEVKTEVNKTILNQNYTGLVPPKNGVKFTINTMDGDKVTFTIGKYFFTGETEVFADENTTFSVSFDYEGRIYEVSVKSNGDLISVDEWYGRNEFEDGNDPDNSYKASHTKKTRGLKWELVDM